MADAFIVTRFLSMADIKDFNHEECWQWKGPFNSNGYGRFSVESKNVLAHRFSFEMFYREIPNGMNVCHKCDQRNCINPNHLWLGTQSENLKDAAKKGRMFKPNTKAHRNGNTTLTWDKVKAIRSMHENGLEKYKIAKIFDVSPSTIGNITNNETWKVEQ